MAEGQELEHSHEHAHEHPQTAGGVATKKHRDVALIVIGVIGLLLTIILIRRSQGAANNPQGAPGATTTTGTTTPAPDPNAASPYADQALQGILSLLQSQTGTTETGSGGAGSSSGSNPSPVNITINAPAGSTVGQTPTPDTPPNLTWKSPEILAATGGAPLGGAERRNLGTTVPGWLTGGMGGP